MPDFLISTESLAWNAGTNLKSLGLPDSRTKKAGETDAWDIGAHELASAGGGDPPTPVEYTLTVNSGTGSGSYSAGSSVDLVAASAPSGQEFDRWTGDVGNVANVNAATTTLTMPAADATVTATYMVDIAPQPPRLRVERFSPTELELGWEVDPGARCEVQARISLNEGVWTTVFTTSASSGSLRIPMGTETSSAYYRIMLTE
jgi:hypothetical protein